MIPFSLSLLLVMVYINEMWGKTPAGEPRYFACNGSIWPKALDLARGYGWKPKGTTLDEKFYGHILKRWREESGYIPPTPGDYEPEEMYKDVSSEDADALADALEKAIGDMKSGKLAVLGKKGPALASDLGETFDEPDARETYAKGVLLANEPLDADYLTKFVKFLRGGKFIFGWDD